MAQFLGFREIASARRGFAAPFWRGLVAGLGPLRDPWYTTPADEVWGGMPPPPAWPSAGTYEVVKEIDFRGCYKDGLVTNNSRPAFDADRLVRLSARGMRTDIRAPIVREADGTPIGITPTRWNNTGHNIHEDCITFDSIYGMWCWHGTIRDDLASTDDVDGLDRFGGRFVTSLPFGPYPYTNPLGFSLNGNYGELIIERMTAYWVMPGSRPGFWMIDGASGVGGIHGGTVGTRLEIDLVEESTVYATSGNLTNYNGTSILDLPPGYWYNPEGAHMWFSNGEHHFHNLAATTQRYPVRIWLIDAVRITADSVFGENKVEYFRVPVTDYVLDETSRTAIMTATTWSTEIVGDSGLTRQQLFVEAIRHQDFSVYCEHLLRRPGYYLAPNRMERGWYPADGWARQPVKGLRVLRSVA